MRVAESGQIGGLITEVDTLEALLSKLKAFLLEVNTCNAPHDELSPNPSARRVAPFSSRLYSELKQSLSDGDAGFAGRVRITDLVEPHQPTLLSNKQ